MRRGAVAGGALLILALGPPGAAGTAELERRLEGAVRGYDADAAQEVVSALRTGGGPAMLTVRAGLALSELLRLEYEETPAGERETRRLLGARIDAAAEEALALLPELPESSERERIRADLLATMIRSDYRAKRFEQELRTAAGRALELQPDNPLALVAAAKPLLFAPPGRGRDLDAAVASLDRALALEPGLESALLLKAHALEQAGRTEEAMALFSRALAANPGCRPARLRLEALGGSVPP